MKKKRQLTAIDRVVAKNIRLTRIKRDISQAKLGESLGVSFQQIQKYESASNRLSVGQFLKIAECLDIRPELLWKADE